MTTPTSTTPRTQPTDIRDDVQAYRGHFAERGDAAEAARKHRYGNVVKGYYDLVTDFYERGWGRSFHFAPLRAGQSRQESLRAYEEHLAKVAGFGPGMHVLDLGCGVGGPLRTVAQATGARVTGINSNAGQVARAQRYNREAGLADRCQVREGDFMNLPFDDGSIDGVYAFEALCHAPDTAGVYREIHRVLKPGGVLAVSEWVMTDRYDPQDPEHRRIKADIELGNGIPDMPTVGETRQAIQDAGLTIEVDEDARGMGDADWPWYRPIAGRDWDGLGFRRGPVGRKLLERLIRLLEATRIAPKGTVDVSEFLNVGADALVQAGERNLFTPMHVFRARKA